MISKCKIDDFNRFPCHCKKLLSLWLSIIKSIKAVNKKKQSVAINANHVFQTLNQMCNSRVIWSDDSTQPPFDQHHVLPCEFGISTDSYSFICPFGWLFSSQGFLSLCNRWISHLLAMDQKLQKACLITHEFVQYRLNVKDNVTLSTYKVFKSFD